MHAASARRGTEWPTVALAAAIYLAWLALTWWHAALPLPVLFLGGAWVTAWHMSLQHETLHGHPTRSRRINDLIGMIPLSPWLSYEAYRRSHLRHHRDEHLTDPLEDPESYYAAPERLRRVPRAMLFVLLFNNTLAGRMLIGPLLSVSSFLMREASVVREGDRAARRGWAIHLVPASLVLAWVHVACGMSLATFAACFLYPGMSLALVRSFAEHRAEPDQERRTAIVQHGGMLGILFLFNNLHVVHHERPGLPWYRLPSAWRANESRIRALGGPIYDSYAEVARRFWRTPHHHPAYPAETI